MNQKRYFIYYLNDSDNKPTKMTINSCMRDWSKYQFTINPLNDNKPTQRKKYQDIIAEIQRINERD